MLLLVPQNLQLAHSKNELAALTSLWLLQLHHIEVESIEMQKANSIQHKLNIPTTVKKYSVKKPEWINLCGLREVFVSKNMVHYMMHVGLVSWEALLSKVPTGHLYSKEPTQNYIQWNIHTHCTVQYVYFALDALQSKVWQLHTLPAWNKRVGCKFLRVLQLSKCLALSVCAM